VINYYIIDNNYKGKRLFKHDTWNNTVVQAVVRTGKKKTGRPNMIGVYNISEMTLKGNYLWKKDDGNFGLAIRTTTKKLFEYYVYEVIRKLLKDSDNGYYSAERNPKPPSGKYPHGGIAQAE